MGDHKPRPLREAFNEAVALANMAIDEISRLRAANVELTEALVQSTHMLDEVFQQAVRLEDRNIADTLAQRCAVNLALIAKHALTKTGSN